MNFFSRKKKLCSQNPSLYLKDSRIFKKGVFSRKKFFAGDIIENCPLIVFTEEQSLVLKNSLLYWYYFVLQPSPFIVTLALGFGSVYNHECPANASFYFDRKKELLIIKAVSDIPAGIEITINYNGDPEDDSHVIFQQSEPIRQ